MNYPESAQILEEVRKSKKILVNCHRSPDADSVGSALAVKKVLEDLGKEVKIICPTKLDENLSFLDGFKNIETVKFEKVPFRQYDLFICLDSAEWRMVTGDSTPLPSNIKIINIDHHVTNSRYGQINLVDERISACAELLYFVFEDWGYDSQNPTVDFSVELLTGIMGDTGGLLYPNADVKTYKVAINLMQTADKNEIIQNLFRNVNFKNVKMWGVFLDAMQIDQDHKFVWSAIPYSIFKKYGKIDVKSEVASNFAQIIQEADFGIIMLEDSKNHLLLSLRSRRGFDVSKIASEFGGGGHKAAAGAEISGLPYREAVAKVLEIARKHAK